MVRGLSVLCSLVLACSACSFFSSSDEAAPKGPTSTEAPGPDPLVVRWPHQFDMTSEDYSAISTATADGDVVYAGGSFTTVKDRKKAPYIAEISPTNELTETFLPTEDAEIASVNAIHVDGAEMFAAGRRTRGDDISVVVWGKSGEDWSLTELPVEGIRPWISGVSDDGRYLYGGSIIDEFDKPLVWENVGGVWQLLAVELGGGDPTDWYLSALDASADGDAIGVGYYTNEGSSSPLIWTVEGAAVKVEKIDVADFDYGRLNDVTVTEAGTTIAVGKQERGGTVPVTLIRRAGETAWTHRTFEVPEAGRVVSGGYGFSKVISRGAEIYISHNWAWVQDPLVSTDEGQTWTTTDLITSKNSPDGTTDEIFVLTDERLMVGDRRNLVSRENGQWRPLSVLPTNTSSTEGSTLLVVDDKLAIVGTKLTKLASGKFLTEGAVWTSTEADPWEKQTIDDATDKYLVDGDTNDESVAYVGYTDVNGDREAGIFFGSGDPVLSDLDESDRLLFRSVVVESDGTAVAVAQLMDISEGSALETVVVRAAPGDEMTLIRFGEELGLDGDVIAPDCLARNEDGYFSLISNESGEMVVARSADGESWDFEPTVLELGKITEVRDCNQVGSEIVIVGTDDDENEYITQPDDLTTWTSTKIGTRNDRINEVVDIDGQLIAVGFRGGEGRKGFGQVWYEKDGEWLALENEGSPTGFEPDALASSTSIRQAVEYGDDIVFFGSDTDRLGLWTMPKADLLAAIG